MNIPHYDNFLSNKLSNSENDQMGLNTWGFIYNYNLFCELPIRSSLAINIQTLHFSFSQDLNKEQEYNWHLSFFGESRWSIIYVFSRNAYLLSLSEIREIINLCNVNIRSIKTLSLQSSNTITNFYAYQRRSKLIQYFFKCHIIKQLHRGQLAIIMLRCLQNLDTQRMQHRYQ